MAKYYGKIGYAMTSEVKPGVWKKSITERNYYGDIIQNTRRIAPSGNLNDNLTLSNTISIVSDPFALDHFQYIVYAEDRGVKWKVTSVEQQFPRLILSIGEVYNVED